MSLFDQFDVDEKKEREGIWKRFKPNRDKTIPAFLIARMGGSNKTFGEVWEAANAPFVTRRDKGQLSESEKNDIAVNVFVDSCLLGWENVQDRKGVSIEFTRENAITLMKSLPRLHDELSVFASDMENYIAEQTEEAAKN